MSALQEWFGEARIYLRSKDKSEGGDETKMGSERRENIFQSEQL